MAEMPGIARPERQALPQLRDREGSRVRTAPQDLPSLFPAHAGVIPSSTPMMTPPATFPRLRGGDSRKRMMIHHAPPFSPPTRG